MPLPKGLKTIGFVAGLSAATAGTTGGCDNHILPPEAPKPVVATVSNSKSGPYFIMCLPDDPSFTYRSDRRRNVVKKLFTTRQYKTFDDFYRVLALTNNINTANFHGPAGIGEGLTDEDSHNHKMNGFEKRSFVVQLLKRANLTGKFIASAPDGIQDNIKAMDGKIVIGHILKHQMIQS